MPISPYGHINCYIQFLKLTHPASILDIGVGNGKLGFIARDLLDVMLGQRHKKSEWQLRLDGIEIFSEYIQDHQKAIYDHIHVGDAFDLVDALDIYDVVVLGEVLEQFPKEKGWLFLDKCFAHANEAVILFVPLGKGWLQAPKNGNAHAAHRSCWDTGELFPMSDKHSIFMYKSGPYGAFLISKTKYVDQRVHLPKDQAFYPSEDTNIRKYYQLAREKIEPISLNHLVEHTANKEYRNYFLDTHFNEHYRLLAYLSTRFNDQTLFDVGTLKGYSALALSYNRNNRIISYDIEDLKELNKRDELTTIEYCIGNALEDPRLPSAPVILLDTYHDGTFEQVFYQHLKKNHYRGLLVLDDIYLNQEMKDFWKSIVEPKEDVTDLGHWSGTGLVDFGIVYQ